MGIGDWGLGPIPNPQSPIYDFFKYIKNNKIIKINKLFKIIIFKFIITQHFNRIFSYLINKLFIF